MLAAKQAWLPAIPPKVLIGNKKAGPENYRALTEDEKYDYTRQTGQRIKSILSEHLDEMNAMDPQQARAMIGKVARAVHEQAVKSWPR